MDDALALLRLQMEWGADEALAPEPFDRFRPPGSLGVTGRVAPAEVHPGVANSIITISKENQARQTSVERAVALAAQAVTQDGLREVLAAFDLCALRDTASNLVFAEGDPASTTLVIGEPPGRDEDRSGHPFAGAEGILLDQMLASIGLERGRLMLTPLLPWRPPGGRPPSSNEVAMCLPFLHRLIVLLGPRRLLLFGASATRAMLVPALTRRRLTPGWLDSSIPGLPEPLRALSMPSLSEMQKTLPLRRVAWAGMRLLRRAIEGEMT